MGSRDADLAHGPTTKLVTASNALTLFGPDTRFTTPIRAGSAVNRVIVQGSGDPSLTSGGLEAMARTTAAALKARKVTFARVYVDATSSPRRRWPAAGRRPTSPARSPPSVGSSATSASSDTSAEAARFFAGRLKAYGIPTVGYHGRANEVGSSAVIASSTGSPVATMVSRMLLKSDSEIAEGLHKLVGIRLGHGATWTGARTAQAKELAGPRPHFGSPARRLRAVPVRPAQRGPAREDRRPWPGPPLQQAAVADAGGPGDPDGGEDQDAEVPVHHDPVEVRGGQGVGQTGTPSDVVAGFTKGTDGRVKVFAFVVNGKSSTTTLKNEVAMLAATVTGSY